MRALVLGASGMLGHKVVQRLARENVDLSWTLRSRAGLLPDAPFLRGASARDLDAIDSVAVRRLMEEVRPDVVVNCIGVIKQRTESLDPVASVSLNALLPHLVAATLARWGGRLIHLSTDCVFSGNRGGYTENETPDATDLYGRSKALGEPIAGNAITLRTSMIGRELRGHASLLDWFLSNKGRTVRGFRRAIWSGVTTLHLADVIAMVLFRFPALSGIYHVSSGRVSKYDLLTQLRAAYDIDIDVVPDDDFVCDRSLVGTRFEDATGYRCPSLRTMIDEMVQDPTAYPELS